MPAGRPTDYKKEYSTTKLQEYLDTCVDVEDTFHKTVGDRSNSFDRLIKVNLPSHEGYAEYLGKTVKTLYNWANEHEEFLQALEIIKQKQKNKLIEKGLSGDYNSTIAKLILSANHGLAEKSDVTSDGKAITIVSHIPDRE